MEQKCMNDDCDNLRHSRGVCPCCYARYTKLISENETTWSELESLGFVLPLKNIGKSTLEKIKAARAAKTKTKKGK